MKIPNGFLILDPTSKAHICNGCGSKGGIDVPDTVYGLSITKSCDIHDYMWHVATTVIEIHEANEDFLYNMRWQIKQASWWLRGVRYMRAYTYYFAVKHIGSSNYIEKKGLK